MQNETVDLAFVINKNKTFIEQYQDNKLIQLIQSDLMDVAENRRYLLDCIQVFSNFFQKTVMLRKILTGNKRFLDVSQAHLEEEFGHDISLMHDRNDRAAKWDPILEGTSSWFAWQMLILDNTEKTFLIHLVLESSANIFFIEAHKVMKKYNETNYFKLHSEVDEQHEAMGMALLKGLREVDYKHLLIVQQQGWDMVNAACTRIAELTMMGSSC